MSRYVNIDELTQEVLASVEAESNVKTASDTTPTLHTEIGQALKHAAANIRGYEDTSVTGADLQAVVEGAKLAVFGGNTTGAQMAGGLGGSAAGALGGAATGAALGTAIMPVVGTALGGLAGGVMGGSMGGTVGSNVAQGTSNMMQSGGVQPVRPQGQVRTASPLSAELRKLAQQIRVQGANNEEIRLTKAAQMLTAAVGLEHLTENL